MTVGGPTITLSNGVVMPQVGLGTWQSKPEEVYNAVKVAIAEGYRLVDTAAVYDNEASIGKALKESFDSGVVKRDEVFVTTKLWTTHLAPERQEQGIKECLERLQLDHVDLLLAHMPAAFDNEMVNQRPEVTVEQLWKGLESLYEKKLTRAIGVSNFSVEQMERIQKIATVPIHNSQVELHLYLPQEEMQAFCTKQKISLTSYSTLSSPGRVNFTLPSGAKLDWAPAPNAMEDAYIKELAAKYNKSPAQILLRWAIDRNIAVIPKSVNENRIKENFKLFDFALTEEEVKKILSNPHRQRLFGQDFMEGHPEDAFKSERKY